MRVVRGVFLGLFCMLLSGATGPSPSSPQDATLISVKIARGGDTPRYLKADGYSQGFENRPFLEVRFATVLNLPEIEHDGQMLQPQAAFCSDLTDAAKGRSMEGRPGLRSPDIEAAPWVDADIDRGSFSTFAALSAALAEWGKGKRPLIHRFYLLAKAGESSWGYAVRRPYDLVSHPADLCFAVTTTWPGPDGRPLLLTKIVTIPKELIAAAVADEKRRPLVVRIASNELSPDNP